jgi:hypothetical protein
MSTASSPGESIVSDTDTSGPADSTLYIAIGAGIGGCLCLLLLLVLLVCLVRRRRGRKDDAGADDDNDDDAGMPASSRASEMRSTEYGSVAAALGSPAVEYSARLPTPSDNSVVYGAFAAAKNSVIYDSTMTQPAAPAIEYGGMPDQ